ncbi:E3 ubiquitin-protein ligase trul-1-like isoform X2 [Planococcus citri]
MNVQISCTICQEDLFTGEDNEAISSTKCGHVYHHRCLLQWMERSQTCPHCRTGLGNNGIFKLNLFIGETSAAPSMAKFEEMENWVKHLTNVESDLKIRLENSEIAHSKLRNKTVELEARVQYLENTESNMSEELKKIVEKLKLLEKDNKSAKSAGEKLKTRNKKLEEEVKSLCRKESSLKKELAQTNLKLQEMEKDLDKSISINEKLNKKNTELKRSIERSIEEHLQVEADLENQLDIKTEKLKNLIKDLNNEKLK